MITPDKQDWHPVEQPPPVQRWRRWKRRSHPAGILRRSPSRRGRHERAPGRASLAGRPRGRMAAASHRRRHRGRTWGHPDRRPHPARDPDRTPGGDRVGMDRRRDPVRLDRNARRASGRGAARHRAHHPDDRPRSRSVGRRCCRGDFTRARRRRPASIGRNRSANGRARPWSSF